MTDPNTSGSSGPAMRRWIGELALRHGFDSTVEPERTGPDEAPKAEEEDDRWDGTAGRDRLWEGGRERRWEGKNR